MKTTSRHHSSGMALIMVMIALALFSMMAVELWSFMKVETRLAQRADNEQQLLWLGRSGVELARWVLAQHPPSEPYDSLNQIWAGGPGGPAETNSALMGIDLGNYPVGDGTVSLKIVDLERKANINTANTPELQQALTLMGVDADALSVVADSIQDWIDADDAQRIAGAENDYYQGLSPPYHAKNAPMDNLAELLLVKGVTPEMYWGTSATNHAPGTFQHPKLGFGTAPGQEPDYPFGLTNIFTAISSGKINLNTADTNVLQLIPGVDALTAANIVKQRAGPDGVDGTEDDMPFRSVGQVAAAGVNPQAVQQLGNYCNVGSSTFEVHVTAKAGDSTREFTAILHRNTGTDIQILSFWWK
jgi:type II secretory pathway component PulK